ncbi:hypothetical protein, partial [Actinoplanes lobatus]
SVLWAFPTTNEMTTPNGIGRYNHFDGGQSIYWSPATGAHEIHGSIRDKWAAMGWETSILGFPKTDELFGRTTKARYSDFQGGSIYWSPATGAHEIHGSINVLWVQRGRDKKDGLGLPTTDELSTPNKPGRYNHFQNGSIYWSPDTGAHEVHGSIRDKWAAMGWENSLLGFPKTDELTTPNGVGRYNHFQGGSIYWSPATGAHEVHGSIRDRWASLGWETSQLGFPTSDEYAIAGGGRRTDFQNNCFIRWYPSTGAQAVCNSVPKF